MTPIASPDRFLMHLKLCPIKGRVRVGIRVGVRIGIRPAAFPAVSPAALRRSAVFSEPASLGVGPLATIGVG